MKSKIQKDNIREMLNAEHLSDSKSPWGDFKRKLGDEFLAIETPRISITPAPRPQWAFFRRLVPAFALLLASVGIAVWLLQPKQTGGENMAGSIKRDGGKTIAFRKGDVFKSERREIRFLRGSAELTQSEGKIVIEATALAADFRLGQKVDMQIRHPLVKVMITGTRFIFDATATGGSIRLTEGGLAIEHVAAASKGSVITLKAPALFSFTGQTYQVAGLKSTRGVTDGLLYRYDLVNGETFFAHRVSVTSTEHRVAVLGGREQTIPVKDILRVEAAENP